MNILIFNLNLYGEWPCGLVNEYLAKVYTLYGIVLPTSEKNTVSWFIHVSYPLQHSTQFAIHTWKHRQASTQFIEVHPSQFNWFLKEIHLRPLRNQIFTWILSITPPLFHFSPPVFIRLTLFLFHCQALYYLVMIKTFWTLNCIQASLYTGRLEKIYIFSPPPSQVEKNKKPGELYHRETNSLCHFTAE